MGYAYYTLADGREAGYGVKDVCNDKDCTEEIDRGLYYLCGETPGGDEYGCGDYFCGSHLFHPAPGAEGEGQCGPCQASWEAEHPEPDEEEVGEVGSPKAS